jgi:hypothetical protein
MLVQARTLRLIRRVVGNNGLRLDGTHSTGPGAVSLCNRRGRRGSDIVVTSYIGPVRSASLERHFRPRVRAGYDDLYAGARVGRLV